MKNKGTLWLASLLVALMGVVPVVAQSEHVINTAGNAYITSGGEAHVDERHNGIRRWSDRETVVSYFFRANECGTVDIALQAKGKSRIEVSLLGKKKKITLDSDELTRVDLGTYKIKKPGHVRVDIRGVKINEGEDYGSVAALIVSGDIADMSYITTDFNSHFGRRGPSVHLGYVLPKEDVEWFYNEVTVPEEGDIPSSYYMACGFGEGYFGMQNNSPHQRKILFSVWSPFNTDNPADIPDSLRVTLVKKGEKTVIKEFGNEGSGGQSYMYYDWKPGERCRFLMGARPDGKGATVYTAYFFDNNKGEWSLVASFRRPKTSTWYRGAHSFLENFSPVQGYRNRKAYYTNQWARTADGRWVPLTKARFTCDGTGNERKRLDYTGGTEGDAFFLSMGGFFDEYMTPGTYFERAGDTTVAPDIDFSTLE